MVNLVQGARETRTTHITFSSRAVTMVQGVTRNWNDESKWLLVNHVSVINTQSHCCNRSVSRSWTAWGLAKLVALSKNNDGLLQLWAVNETTGLWLTETEGPCKGDARNNSGLHEKHRCS